MAKFTFECKDCQFSKDVIRPVCPAPGFMVCGHCNRSMTRVSGAPTMRMVEILDNGLMTRRVERPANAEQLYKDRAIQADIDKTKL